MEHDTLQEAQRRAQAAHEEGGARLTPVEARHLTGIPVLDEEAGDGLRPDELLVIAPDAVTTVRVPARESAPVSVRGRLALAREMLVRAVSELDVVIAEVGQDSDLPKEARLDALTAVSHLDSELRLRWQ